MANAKERQQVHRAVLRGFVENGHAPHYTELADTLGIEPESARKLIHETCVESPFSFAWVTPDTDFIAAWAPFSNLPTHNVITVEGRRLHGQ